MHRISVIFGTRPEAIKLAPVVLALRARADIECRVCITAQHRQMLDQVLEAFGIVPDVDLNLMRKNQTLPSLTARAIAALYRYLASELPDLLLVQGDTTTVLCAALAAFYRRVPLGHVEAGLRTWDMRAPWPEEANRVLTTRLATLHFAPTQWSKRNLLREASPRTECLLPATRLSMRSCWDYGKSELIHRGSPACRTSSNHPRNTGPAVWMSPG